MFHTCIQSKPFRTNICIPSVGCPTWHGDTIVNQSSDVESQEVKLLERKITMLKFA